MYTTASLEYFYRISAYATSNFTATPAEVGEKYPYTKHSMKVVVTHS